MAEKRRGTVRRDIRSDLRLCRRERFAKTQFNRGVACVVPALTLGGASDGVMIAWSPRV